jgi:hypothetical protein
LYFQYRQSELDTGTISFEILLVEAIGIQGLLLVLRVKVFTVLIDLFLQV